MWKKIRSNRDPNETIYSEVRKEFRPYFDKLFAGLLNLLGKFPGGVFTLMVLLMVVSMVLTFTVFRHPEPLKKVGNKATVSPLNDGFDQILQAGAQLKETIRLKKIVDSISHRKKLSTQDSTGLVQALDSLRKIHPNLK